MNGFGTIAPHTLWGDLGLSKLQEKARMSLLVCQGVQVLCHKLMCSDRGYYRKTPGLRPAEI